MISRGPFHTQIFCDSVIGVILLCHLGTVESVGLPCAFQHMPISYMVQDGERTRDAEAYSVLSRLEFSKPGTLFKIGLYTYFIFTDHVTIYKTLSLVWLFPYKTKSSGKSSETANPILHVALWSTLSLKSTSVKHSSTPLHQALYGA